MSIYDKHNDTDKKISKEEDNTTLSSYDKNANIIKLYKEGMSKEDIAKKLNCSITEIDIVIDLELE
nr:helix-turn-helix domain-containing protein [Brachyspira murdochii]